MFASRTARPYPPAIARLHALSPLDAAAHAALTLARQHPRTFRIRRELHCEGREVYQPFLILKGWATRVRLLEDGRRQILNLLMPGDIVGLYDHDRPVASSTVTAMTEIEACVAPDAGASPALARAYAHSRALEEAYLLSQITRLGRMDAYERIADLLLEMLERAELAGLAHGGGYEMPVTQEVLADCLGLTSVHVNRTLQALRKDKALDLRSREVVIADPVALRHRIGRTPVRVTAMCPVPAEAE